MEAREHPCRKRQRHLGEKRASRRHFTFKYATWLQCCEIPNKISWASLGLNSECYDLQLQDNEKTRPAAVDPDKLGWCSRKTNWSVLRRVKVPPPTLEGGGGDSTRGKKGTSGKRDKKGTSGKGGKKDTRGTSGTSGKKGKP